MTVIEKENYKILQDEENDVKNFASFLEYKHEKFRDENLVVDILKYNQLQLVELLSFLELSNKHRKTKRSFVIVNNTVHMDAVPEELVVVPSLKEAEDIIQMEEIERELGF